MARYIDKRAKFLYYIDNNFYYYYYFYDYEEDED